MKLHRIACIVMVSGQAMWAQQTSSPQRPPFDDPQPPQSLPRFEGKVSIRVGANPVTVGVSLKDWVVRNRQSVRVPEQGSLFVEVRSGGKVTIIIGDLRAEYKDRDFFTVPGGASFQVETGNDTAVFTVLSLVR